MRTVILTVAALIALAGCGGSGTAKADDAGSGTPKCSDVWVDGATLPKDYDGCMSGSDMLEASVTSDCADGSQLGGYDDRFYALLGGTIHEVKGEIADDAGYKAAVDAC